MSSEPQRAPAPSRFSLEVSHPFPFEDSGAFWRMAAIVATIGMFLLAFGAFLYFARAFLVPIFAAAAVAMTVGPLSARAERAGIPTWMVATAIVLLMLGTLYVAVIALAAPASELIGRSSEIGAAIRDKFQLFERPLDALRELQKAVQGKPDSAISVDVNNEAGLLASIAAVITPAAAQIVLFFATLFFFILGRQGFRAFMVNLFHTRDGRLRALKILSDIERNLSRYLLVVTVINLCVGVVAVIATWLLGLPSPLFLGAMAFALNYLPYIGPAIMHLTLFVLGLVIYPSFWWALIPPGFFILFTIIEGQIIMPYAVGRSLLLKPLAVFLNLAFWAWLWGPVGAFLSVPILIVGTVAMNHLYPAHKIDLPE